MPLVPKCAHTQANTHTDSPGLTAIVYLQTSLNYAVTLALISELQRASSVQTVVKVSHKNDILENTWMNSVFQAPLSMGSNI